MLPISKVHLPNIFHSTQNFSLVLNWEWLDHLRFQETTSINSITDRQAKCISLENTQISCCISTNAGAWKNRLIFIKTIVEDLFEKCPKDEELTLVSMGSDALLMECMIGQALIKNGFQRISFLLIDPSYSHLTSSNTSLKEFREWIANFYANKWKEPFPPDRIRYLSCAQNSEKYFKNYSNVILLESMPPYGQLINTMKSHHFSGAKPEELFMGNVFVESSKANAIAFLPRDLKNAYKSPDTVIPLYIFKNTLTNALYYIDWGCKIYPNGEFFLNFFGIEEHWKGYETDNLHIFKYWRNKTTNNLQQKINFLKKNSGKILSQKHITELLIFVKQELENLEIPCETFFLKDYSIDRAHLLSFLSKEASCHYRKAFSLVADPSTIFKINQEIF